MKKASVLCLLICYLPQVFADVYKWVDSQGVTHFSDTPHSGSVPIQLPQAQTYSKPQEPIAPKNELSNETKNTYQSLAIAEPNDQATIRNVQGYIPVLVNIEPQLQAGNQLQLIFDDNPIGNPQSTLGFILNGVVRGTHTISVNVIDKEGNTLMSSDTITVFVHKTHIINPGS